MKCVEKRTGKGYEIQFYSNAGNYSFVAQCEDLIEVAFCLIRLTNSNISTENNPTVFKNGERIDFTLLNKMEEEHTAFLEECRRIEEESWEDSQLIHNI